MYLQACMDCMAIYHFVLNNEKKQVQFEISE